MLPVGSASRRELSCILMSKMPLFTSKEHFVAEKESLCLFASTAWADRRLVGQFLYQSAHRDGLLRGILEESESKGLEM